ncbi:MAG: B12-binding domain-containing radical SAM protein [Thermoplasmata archaeon]|nr:B12-binding domain-containing radical SAM protein [Thermoplasmata archaeon]
MADRVPAARSRGRSAARLLLVDPYVAREDPMERKYVELYPSLGLLTLGAYARTQRIVPTIVDLTFARDLAPVRAAIRDAQPDLVGVHTKSLTARRAMEVARMAAGAGVPSVAGGPDAATRPELYLDGGFDAVVPGEGERTVVDLTERAASGETLVGTPGSVTRTGGKLTRGPPRSFLRDLDELPLPAWDLIDMDGYLGRWERRTGERRAAVLTSRGCPFDCSWCSKPTFGRTYRQQSPERVVAELEALRARFRVDYVRFCDDVFGVNRRWLEELLDRMDRSGLDLKFECLARVELLKPDLLARMRTLGLARVYVGVESGSQKMLDLMNRGTRLAQIERAAESLRTEGIRQFWFLMLGYPGETLDDIEATLRLFRRFSPEEYSVSIAVPVPGTRFYDSVRERLKPPARRRASTGGTALLFEAAYPRSMYRWEQARFDLEAALRRAHGRLSDRLIAQIANAADRFHERVATPLILGTGAAARARSARTVRSPRPVPAVTPVRPG